MSISISVIYPKPITIPAGATIHIMGAFEEPDKMLAWYIAYGEQGQTYQLHADEHPEVKHYAGPIPWKSPMIAQVISSMQYGGATRLSVFPTDQEVYDYNRTLEPMRRAAVPAFWKLVDQQRQWERTFSPLGLSLFEIRREQPQVFNASPTVQKLFDLFDRKRCFQVTHAVDYLWRSLQKLCQVERHLQRLHIIDDLRRHLFSISRSDGREFVLRDTEEEAGLIVEAAATIAYSALDLLGHVINEIYQLGIANNVANFMNTVTDKRRDEEPEAKEGRCLQANYPHDPLTIFLVEQRNGWIRDLEAWRHYIVHHGVLDTGNFVDGGVVIQPPKTEPELLKNMRFDTDATAIVTGWAANLRQTLLEAYRLIGEKADLMAALSDEELPVGKYTEDQFQIDRSRPMKELLEFFRLWQANDADISDRINWMFTRLHPDWQKEWPFPIFRTFIQAHPLRRYSFTGSIGSGTNRPTTARVVLDLDGVKVTWGVAMVPYKNKYVLIRTPDSTFPALQPHLAMTSLRRVQSGRDTGHRDVVFTGVIKNTGDARLEDVSLHILLGTLCGVSANIGVLDPSEEHAFELIWKDGCVSPDSRNSYFPVRAVYFTPGLVVRVVYKLPTPEGNIWAEDAAI